MMIQVITAVVYHGMRSLVLLWQMEGHTSSGPIIATLSYQLPRVRMMYLMMYFLLLNNSRVGNAHPTAGVLELIGGRLCHLLMQKKLLKHSARAGTALPRRGRSGTRLLNR